MTKTVHWDCTAPKIQSLFFRKNEFLSAEVWALAQLQSIFRDVDALIANLYELLLLEFQKVSREHDVVFLEDILKYLAHPQRSARTESKGKAGKYLWNNHRHVGGRNRYSDDELSTSCSNLKATNVRV
jgi:hypothetical protein